MRRPPLEYLGYEATRSRANIVVDGSPNESTVLTLTHWPGIPTPPGMSADLSAQMAFRYLDAPPPHEPAEVVTNNHFDQDGLASIHALVDPEQSLQYRDLLIDVAAAGDFATYTDRRAARASMALSAYAQQDGSCEYDDSTDQLYVETLPLLIPMLLDNDRFRDLWGEEDADLEASEKLITTGAVKIHEHPELDLAVVTIPEAQPMYGGRRFGHGYFHGLHPMAVNNATNRFRLLLVHGRHYEYTDRYETWVQYQSRRSLPRVDMSSAAKSLSSLEAGRVTWEADVPGSLMPQLRHSDESSLDPEEVVRVISEHLRSGPAAWDP